MADPGREMSEEYESVKKRKSFLIDPDGTLVKIYHKVIPADHAQEVLDDLLERRHIDLLADDPVLDEALLGNAALLHVDAEFHVPAVRSRVVQG